MKKELLIILGIIAFIVFNVYASSSFNSDTKISLQNLGKMAIANAEEGDGFKCWNKSNMLVSFGGRTLTCVTCVYQNDAKPDGDNDGICSSVN